MELTTVEINQYTPILLHNTPVKYYMHDYNISCYLKVWIPYTSN